MKGKRLFSFWGDFKMKDEEEIEEEEKGSFEFYGTLNDVVQKEVSEETIFDLRVLERAMRMGLVNTKIIDCPKLNSEGWRNLDEETRNEILRL